MLSTVLAVFLVDRADVLTGGDPKQPASAGGFKPGAFLEVKRLARVDLSDTAIESNMSESSDDGSNGVLRKGRVIEEIVKKNGGAT